MGSELKLEWREGYPTKHYAEEWVIAITEWGDRVVLRALPEEYSYDFTTADCTYIKKEKIKKWMQFPDSNYIAPDSRPSYSLALSRAVEVVRANRAGFCHDQHDKDRYDEMIDEILKLKEGAE